MNDFDRALTQFCLGELRFEKLLEVLDDAVARNEDVFAQLDRAFQTGTLSAPNYHVLVQSSRRRRASAVETDDDSTRLMTEGIPPMSGIDGQKTIVLSDAVWPAPPADATTTENPQDQATRMASGSQSTHSSKAPLTADTDTNPSNMDTSSHLKVGDVLKDRFVLEAILGAGGMGVVFKALDLRKKEASDKDPYVAIKVLNPVFGDNRMSLIALQRETKRAQALSHPNIINVFDFDRDGAHVFMSMEFLNGRPLNQLIRELPEGGLSFAKAWPIVEGMADALAYAHKRQIVHSDFKPGNVFVDENEEVKVLDFGIACAVGHSEKGDTTVFNARDLGALTPAYASLEMLEGEDPDPRDDIYALACVTYELLTGKHPFGKLSAQKASELGLKPKPVPGLSSRRWKALQWALALKREDRIPSVGAFVKALKPRSPVFYGGWVAGVFIALAVGGNVYLSFKPAPPPPPVEPVDPSQLTKINDLLELAAIHFDVGYLTAPTGSNALWAYREVLKIDPYNDAAMKGIRKIADTLEQRAWESYERGDRVESLKRVNEGLEADPQHQGLLKLRGRLQG